MEITTITEPNYRINYTAVQMMLPLDLTKKIDKKDPVVTFAEVMKGIDLRKYLKKDTHRGNQGYESTMMLNIMLFAEMEGLNSLREIADRCRTDIRYMWLANELMPSHMAFQRFEQSILKKSIKDIFFEISDHIATLMNVDRSIQYIDGTKLEANAYKNSFVYKTRVVNAIERLNFKITESIIQLNQEYGFNFLVKWKYCSQEVGYIVQYLMEVMVREDIEIRYGIGKRKNEVQRFYDEILGYALKMMEYEENLFICGNRNSYSKTDHDATMMNTKYDYYNQTGVSKPCYNVQIAVSDGLIMNAGVYQSPGDMKHYIPFMEQYNEYMKTFPKWTITDAGYGSYDNYFYCLEHGIELGMKYNYYAKKNDSNFKKLKFNTMNWPNNEEGYKICPQGNVFDQHLYDREDNEGHYYKINQVYGCHGCEECPLKNDCTKSAKRRTISINGINNEFQKKVDENLGTEEGIKMKIQRSIQVEGAFGIIKQDRMYTRIRRRGLENVEMEILKMVIGFNLKKYHLYQIRKNCQA